jgi:outer membrane protein OmpA-like peptidoglycan-associated protein
VRSERKAGGEVVVQTVALPGGGVERRAVPGVPVATAADGGVVVAAIPVADGGVSAPAANVAVAVDEDTGDDERDEDEVKRTEQAAAQERARAETARLTADADGDGVPDVADRCPYEPETKNGIRDEDGCPEADLAPGSPLAKVLAARTRPTPASPTPNAAISTGALPSSADAGAPSSSAGAGTPLEAAATELPDADDDGVPDAMDRCPATPEDLDGFEDQDGCPEPDNDGDGIADAKDKCPDEAETVNGVDDEDGCPDTAKDSDKDGVADELDRCPFEPGSGDGCPRAPLPHAAALAALLEPRPEPATLPAEAAAAPGVAPRTELERDSDGDGIPDVADRCPVTPEDKDGFEDDDGCPEPDNDGDGIPDAKDKCPNEAETFNGNADGDGCPDEPLDADGDGVDYEHDRCPLEKGDASDGCPHAPLPALALSGFPGLPKTEAAAENAPATEPTAAAPSTADFDHDGVPDEADACPTSPEDQDGFEDDDGCPEPDNDRDGIPDAKDKCPLVAETINGLKDDDGCPDVGTGVVTVKGDHVVIDGVVRFKTASANLEKASLPLLQQVASTLKAWAALSIEIQGHTDDVGSAATNVKLSKKRAEAIRAVLVKAGVAPNRLVANGYGPTRPRASNKTAAGREQNRRVEFLILGESQ